MSAETEAVLKITTIGASEAEAAIRRVGNALRNIGGGGGGGPYTGGGGAAAANYGFSPLRSADFFANVGIAGFMQATLTGGGKSEGGDDIKDAKRKAFWELTDKKVAVGGGGSFTTSTSSGIPNPFRQASTPQMNLPGMEPLPGPGFVGIPSTPQAKAQQIQSSWAKTLNKSYDYRKILGRSKAGQWLLKKSEARFFRHLGIYKYIRGFTAASATFAVASGAAIYSTPRLWESAKEMYSGVAGIFGISKEGAENIYTDDPEFLQGYSIARSPVGRRRSLIWGDNIVSSAGIINWDNNASIPKKVKDYFLYPFHLRDYMAGRRPDYETPEIQEVMKEVLPLRRWVSSNAEIEWASVVAVEQKTKSKRQEIYRNMIIAANISKTPGFVYQEEKRKSRVRTTLGGA